jgi:HPt (histidine-containing phosphotransfer) domain-containing protein
LWLVEANSVAGSWGAGNSGKTMSLHFGRIDWMPSPPLVPDCAPIDEQHLARMTLGDAGLAREVLGLFAAQAAQLMAALAALPPEAAALAHTLKGSARAIGAFAVAEAADELEQALRKGEAATEALPALGFAVEAAREAIAGRLTQH